MCRKVIALLIALSATSVAAQVSSSADHAHSETWRIGAVVDLTAASRGLALGGRDPGLQLGHSDVSAQGPLGRHLRAGWVASLATHEGRLERAVEEAWLETLALPSGLQLRLGRFPSQIGYLNAQHPHADDFSERPLLYRAFLGNHWNDDGLRLNWTAPTPIYWMMGAEWMNGRKLIPESTHSPRSPGVMTAVARIGADFDRSHSWQIGLSHIRNRREASATEDEAHEDGHDAGHAHEPHGALFSGRRTWMLDATWKWAPDGNNRNEQVRVHLEIARISGLASPAASSDRHRAGALSVVWRFHPNWEAGLRADWLRARQAHDGDFEDVRLRERSVMVAWKPSHMQTLRLQYTNQRQAVGIESPAHRAFQLQYILAFGAHGPHAY